MHAPPSSIIDHHDIFQSHPSHFPFWSFPFEKLKNSKRFQKKMHRVYRVTRKHSAYLNSVSNELRSNTDYSKLDASGMDLWDEGLRVLTLFLRSNAGNVREIDVSNCGVTTLGVSYLLDSLLTNSKIQRVFLSFNHIDERGVRMIRDFQKRRCHDEPIITTTTTKNLPQTTPRR